MDAAGFAATVIVLFAVYGVLCAALAVIGWLERRGLLDDVRLPWEEEAE